MLGSTQPLLATIHDRKMASVVRKVKQRWDEWITQEPQALVRDLGVLSTIQREALRV